MRNSFTLEIRSQNELTGTLYLHDLTGRLLERRDRLELVQGITSFHLTTPHSGVYLVSFIAGDRAAVYRVAAI